MAKGRKLTTSRSEMFLGSFDYNQGGDSVNGASELGEDEVWSMVDEAVNEENHSTDREWNSRASSLSGGGFGGSYMSRHAPPRTSRHRHHHHHRQVGGLSLAFDDDSRNASSPSIVHQIRAQDMAESPRGHHLATSAPVNVPDWSKIYRVDSVESLHDSDDGLIDDSELIPPHEYLARQYASSRKMAANSVFEGVGRTLKGRDLSRVRDAVWSQTGFDG